MPILDYISSVWSYERLLVQTLCGSKIFCYFLVHRFAPVLASKVILDGYHQENAVRLRLWNKVVTMDENRICKCHVEWNLEKCTNNQRLKPVGMTDNFKSKSEFIGCEE